MTLQRQEQRRVGSQDSSDEGQDGTGKRHRRTKMRSAQEDDTRGITNDLFGILRT